MPTNSGDCTRDASRTDCSSCVAENSKEDVKIWEMVLASGGLGKGGGRFSSYFLLVMLGPFCPLKQKAGTGSENAFRQGSFNFRALEPCRNERKISHDLGPQMVPGERKSPYFR